MGRSSAYPPNFVGDPTVAELTFQFTDPTIRPTMAELLRYARSHHVDRFASVEIHAYPDGTMMHSFGAVQSDGGVLVAPACGHASLTQTQAPYTQILQSQRRLVRAHTLLLTAQSGRDRALEAPRRLIARTDAVLHRRAWWTRLGVRSRRARPCPVPSQSAAASSNRPGRPTARSGGTRVTSTRASLANAQSS